MNTDKFNYDYISQSYYRIPAKDYSEIIKERVNETLSNKTIKKTRNSNLLCMFKEPVFKKINGIFSIKFGDLGDPRDLKNFPHEIGTREISLRKNVDFITNIEVILTCNNLVIYKNKLNKFLENKCKTCNTLCEKCVAEHGISKINNIYSADVAVDIISDNDYIKKFEIVDPTFILPISMLQGYVKMSFTPKIYSWFHGDIELSVKYTGIVANEDFRHKMIDNYYVLDSIYPPSPYGDKEKYYIFPSQSYKILCQEEFDKKILERNNEKKKHGIYD